MNQHVNEWSSVVEKVQQAAIGRIEQQKNKEAFRKQKYREYLFYQMDESARQQSQTFSKKKAQKERAQKLKQQYQQSKFLMHSNLRKREQDYQSDNLDLIQQKRKKKTDDHNKKQCEKWDENPFIKLVDKQQERKKMQKKHFQQQYEMNKKQHEIKENQKREQERLNALEKEKYSNYIQQSYIRNKSDREKFKNKYLGLQPHERQKIKTQPDSLDQEYKQYLSFQVNQFKEKKRKAEQIEGSLVSLNRNIDNLTSSPAYLGKNPNNFDREKQLFLIDKNLEVKTKGESTNVTPFPVKQIQQKNSTCQVRKIDETIRKSSSPQKRKIDTIKQQKIQKLFPSEIDEGTQEKTKKDEQSFRSFNIISGRKEEFFLNSNI